MTGSKWYYRGQNFRSFGSLESRATLTSKISLDEKGEATCATCIYANCCEYGKWLSTAACNEPICDYSLWDSLPSLSDNLKALFSTKIGYFPGFTDPLWYKFKYAGLCDPYKYQGLFSHFQASYHITLSDKDIKAIKENFVLYYKAA